MARGEGDRLDLDARESTLELRDGSALAQPPDIDARDLRSSRELMLFPGEGETEEKRDQDNDAGRDSCPITYTRRAGTTSGGPHGGPYGY